VVVTGGRAASAGDRAAFRCRRRRGLVAADLNPMAGFRGKCVRAALRHLRREQGGRHSSLGAGGRGGYGRSMSIFHAGISRARPGTPDEVWERTGRCTSWPRVGSAAVVERCSRAAALFPITASAAGLLNIVESASYELTKTRRRSVREWLAIAYGARLRLVPCPQLVRRDDASEETSAASMVCSRRRICENVKVMVRNGSYTPHAKVLDTAAQRRPYCRWLWYQKLFAQVSEVGCRAICSPRRAATDQGCVASAGFA